MDNTLISINLDYNILNGKKYSDIFFKIDISKRVLQSSIRCHYISHLLYFLSMSKNKPFIICR